MISKRTALAILLALVSLPASASITISFAPTQNVTCSADVCVPTASNAVLNVTDLENLLASGNVEVTTAGTGVQAKDIVVKAALSWSSTSTLGLDSYRSISVDQSISVQGVSGLTLTTNDGGKNGELSFGSKGNVTFANLASSLVINGAVYTLVNDLTTLATDVAANPSGNFALANNYDASGDGTFGNSPISTTFVGRFEGLGNTISNLSIYDLTKKDYVGLFSYIDQGGWVGDLNLIAANVTGGKHAEVGTLAGVVYGSATHIRASGAVSGNAFSEGGLIGLASYGTIDSCSASVSVSANREYGAGGLVGYEFGGTISNSRASGAVSSGWYAGGLAGINSGTITRSHSSGNAFGKYGSGGLVGFNVWTVDTSYATGSVGNGYKGSLNGGLVGENVGTITASYASGSVAGIGALGGLVGVNMTGPNGNGGIIEQSSATGPVKGKSPSGAGGLVGVNGSWSVGEQGGEIDQSFATGSVSGGDNTGDGTADGGLLGYNVAGSVSNSYAMGAVSGGKGANVGGLVGTNGYAGNSSEITDSYSTGMVTGGAGAYVGGLLGYETDNAGSTSSSYWDTDMSGITNLSQGAGYPANDPGITGLTTVQFQSGLPTGFDPKIWAETSSVIDGLPYLINNPPLK